MILTNNQNKLLITILPILGLLIGGFLTHIYTLKSKSVEIWDNAKLSAYTEYIQYQSNSSRYTIAFIGGPMVVKNLGDYIEATNDTSNKKAKNDAIIELFNSMRDELSPTKELIPNKSLRWILLEDTMSKMAVNEATEK
jgi:hypothetical protein